MVLANARSMSLFFDLDIKKILYLRGIFYSKKMNIKKEDGIPLISSQFSFNFFMQS